MKGTHTSVPALARLAPATFVLAAIACGHGAPPRTEPSTASTVAQQEAPVDLTGDMEVVAEALVKTPRAADLLVDTEVLRTHPVGRQLGPWLAAVPAWGESLRILGADPLEAHEWLYLTGPSLARAQDATLFLRATGDEAAVDRAFEELARRSTAPAETLAPSSVPPANARAVRVVPVRVDQTHRVALRAHPRLVVLTAPDVAPETARALSSVRVLPSRHPPEAVRLWVARPHEASPWIPACIADLRARVVALANGGAELFAEGTCGDDASASAAADDARRKLARANGFLVRLATRGLLNNAEITTEGPRVRAHVVASREQLEATLRAIGALLGAPPSRPLAPTSAHLP